MAQDNGLKRTEKTVAACRRRFCSAIPVYARIFAPFKIKGHKMRHNMAMLAAGIVVLVSGCDTYVVREPYYDDRPVVAAPPPLHHENPGHPPASGFIWTAGYWNWIGASYVWVPGRWVAPRPGYVWIPHRWERENGHWRPQSGRWEAEQHRASPPRIEHSRENRPQQEIRVPPTRQRDEERSPRPEPRPMHPSPAVDLPRHERHPDSPAKLEEHTRLKDKADRRSERNARHGDRDDDKSHDERRDREDSR